MLVVVSHFYKKDYNKYNNKYREEDNNYRVKVDK